MPMTTYTDGTFTDTPDRLTRATPRQLAALFDVALERDLFEQERRLLTLMLDANRLPARGGLATRDRDAYGPGYARQMRSF